MLPPRGQDAIKILIISVCHNSEMIFIPPAHPVTQRNSAPGFEAVAADVYQEKLI